MGSSAKKKKEKKKDFQKPKLKVGKARPKNTNATDTSFAAKSVVFKQQSLAEGERSDAAVFQHNLSLLSSKNETQRRDALAYLTTACSAHHGQKLPQPASVIIAKAQPLALDGNPQVRQQLLKLLRSLPADQIGSPEQLILYIRAGMSHLSNDIKATALHILDWLLESNATSVVASPGGWVKTLRTFQNLLSWHGSADAKEASTRNGSWSNTKSTSNMGSSKLAVHQLTTLAHLLTAGLEKPSLKQEHEAAANIAAERFPVWHMDAHMLPKRSNPYGYLNLFGSQRDAESEIFEDAEERSEVLEDCGLLYAFKFGVTDAKREGGEVGRAAALVDKALKLADG